MTSPRRGPTRSHSTCATRPRGSWPSSATARGTSTRTTSKAMWRPTRLTSRTRCRDAATTCRRTSVRKPSSSCDSRPSGEACEEQTELEKQIHRDRDQRLVERVRGRRDERSDHEDQQEHVAALFGKPVPADHMDPNERVDDDGHLKDHAHAQDEDRHEGEVVGGSQLVLDDLTAEVDQELDRVGKQDEIAESHAEDEEEDHGQAHETDETALAREERRVDVGVYLVEDHRHGEGDAREERHPEVGREVLGRAERDEVRRRGITRVDRYELAIDRNEQKPDDGRAEVERDPCGDDERDRSHHEPIAQLAEVLNERKLFVPYVRGH